MRNNEVHGIQFFVKKQEISKRNTKGKGKKPWKIAVNGYCFSG